MRGKCKKGNGISIGLPSEWCAESCPAIHWDPKFQCDLRLTRSTTFPLISLDSLTRKHNWNFISIMSTSWDICTFCLQAAILDFPLPVSLYHSLWSRWIAWPRKHGASRWNFIPILSSSVLSRPGHDHISFVYRHLVMLEFLYFDFAVWYNFLYFIILYFSFFIFHLSFVVVVTFE